MKATTWLCPIVLTLLCAARLVCTAQRGGIYPYDYADTNMIQDDYLLEKRNKPSLSIVNPLDVLRQRLLLEIARRQMKENTRQVELNRAILKNVGKRRVPVRGAAAAGGGGGGGIGYDDLARYQMSLEQLQQYQQQQPYAHQHLYQQQYLPNLYEYTPTASIFDFLQRPSAASLASYDVLPLDDEKKTMNYGLNKYQQLQKQQQQQQQNGIGNEIINETKHKNMNDATNKVAAAVAANVATDIINDTYNNSVGAAADVASAPSSSSSNIDNDNDNDENTNNNNNNNNANAGYQLRYLYHLHKNHFAKK